MKSQCILNYDVLPQGEEQQVYLLVKVKGEQAKGDREPVPLNISLVIDRSGSMRGEKLEFVKQASLELIRRLGSKDVLSVVAYDDVIETPLPPGLVEDKEAIRRTIYGLTARNMTDLCGGWQQGCKLVEGELREGQVNRVLLLSDGLANRGVTALVQLEAMVRQERSKGITTTTLGVGMDFNEDLLSHMAVEGGGAFYFIDNPDQATAFFNEELKDLQNVVGKNLKIALDPGHPIRAVQQLSSYPLEERGGSLTYRLGDIYSEEEMSQVFELTLSPLEQGETKLGMIRISFDEFEGEEVVHREETFEVVVGALPEKDLAESIPNVEVEKFALVQKAARARRRAVKLADQRKFNEAAVELRSIAELIEHSGIDDKDLQSEHDMLLEEAADMKLGAERYDAHARKMHASKASHSHRHRRHHQMVMDLHQRHKLSRSALERGGEPPRRIRWNDIERALEVDVLTIGRAEDNDIVLRDPTVSPYHCRIERERGEWYLIDLGSDFGTFANSGKVKGRFRLSAGDVMTVGSTLLQLKG